MAYAQNTAVNTGAIWKKKTTRTIDLAKRGGNGYLKSSITDSSLSELIIDAVKTGKLTAYSNTDNGFTITLTRDEINGTKATCILDSISVIDPVTGSEITKAVDRNIHYDSFHKYRIMEEWTIDPRTGNTEIQILGIAPVHEIIGDDGVFRGALAMFWVKYADVAHILARYDSAHPGNTFGSHVWADNFADSIAPGNEWHTKATLFIDLSQKEDNLQHHFKDVSQDMNVYSIIVNAIKIGQVAGYAGNDPAFNNNKLTYDSLRKKIGIRTDTLMVVNPVDNVEEMKTSSGGFERYSLNTYYLLEEWKFDIHAGKTDVQVTGIGPEKEFRWGVADKSYSREEAVFWVRYADIRNAITRYEQYHPDNTIAGHVWNSYFVNEVKPVILK